MRGVFRHVFLFLYIYILRPYWRVQDARSLRVSSSWFSACFSCRVSNQTAVPADTHTHAHARTHAHTHTHNSSCVSGGFFCRDSKSTEFLNMYTYAYICIYIHTHKHIHIILVFLLFFLSRFKWNGSSCSMYALTRTHTRTHAHTQYVCVYI